MEKVKTTFSVLFIVSFCHFLNDTIQSMLPAIYPMLKSDFGLSFSQIGLITLALQTTSSIVQPLVGLYADKHHHSWQLAVGMLFTLSGIAQLSFASNFWMILGAVSLFGCGSSIFHPQGSQAAQLASGGRKGLAQGIFQVGGNAGFALGPLLAGIIILPHGIQSVRWFGVLAILCAILLSYVGWWHVKELKNFTRKIRERWTIAENVSRGKIHFFVFILFMLMFSKNFYSASMTNYFTFFLIDKFHLGQAFPNLPFCLSGLAGDRHGSRRTYRRQVRSETRHLVFNSRGGAFHHRASLYRQFCRNHRTFHRHRINHVVRIPCDSRLCHGSLAKPYGHRRRDFLRAFVRACRVW